MQLSGEGTSKSFCGAQLRKLKRGEWLKQTAQIILKGNLTFWKISLLSLSASVEETRIHPQALRAQLWFPQTTTLNCAKGLKEKKPCKNSPGKTQSESSHSRDPAPRESQPTTKGFPRKPLSWTPPQGCNKQSWQEIKLLIFPFTAPMAPWGMWGHSRLQSFDFNSKS